uniref:Lectin n=1 Tax=Ulva limnetica TaxID=549311 RepID=B9A6I7_9CHLO|nr:lectin [Ulva limnetica]
MGLLLHSTIFAVSSILVLAANQDAGAIMASPVEQDRCLTMCPTCCLDKDSSDFGLCLESADSLSVANCFVGDPMADPVTEVDAGVTDVSADCNTDSAFQLLQNSWSWMTSLPSVFQMSIQAPGSSRRYFAAHVYYGSDNRDSASTFVCSHDTGSKKAILLTVPAAQGGVKLMVLENRDTTGKGKTEGRYLSAHNYYSSDRVFSGQIRLMIHTDPNKAAVWRYEGNKLKVVQNLDATAPDTAGWYLTAPSEARRDSASTFLTVQSDASKAALVIAETVTA